MTGERSGITIYRRLGEWIEAGDIAIQVREFRGGGVRLYVEAPRETPITRPPKEQDQVDREDAVLRKRMRILPKPRPKDD